jgi:hypothetical protein
MKKIVLILAILGLCALPACAILTGSQQGEGSNKLKKSPCAAVQEGLRHV